MIEIICDKCGKKQSVESFPAGTGFKIPDGWGTYTHHQILSNTILFKNYCPECNMKIVGGD